MYLGSVILPNNSIIHFSVATSSTCGLKCLYRIDSNEFETVSEKTYYGEGIHMCQFDDIDETFLFAIICSGLGRYSFILTLLQFIL